MKSTFDIMIDYALSWVGTPYIWGGYSFNGFDCSGLVQEILASVGMDLKGDQTADQLYRHFYSNGIACTCETGALAFYGDDVFVHHVAFCVSDKLVIEAGGGSKNIKTAYDAQLAGAFVKIRPVNRRDDLFAVIMPNYNF